jgi:hypothetical protein
VYDGHYGKTSFQELVDLVMSFFVRAAGCVAVSVVTPAQVVSEQDDREYPPYYYTTPSTDPTDYRISRDDLYRQPRQPSSNEAYFREVSTKASALLALQLIVQLCQAKQNR